MTTILPVHVLDREIDFTILYAVLLCMKSKEDILFGDEHNLGSLYQHLHGVNLVRHGCPTKDPRRRSWNMQIKENGGQILNFNVEGNNNLPFQSISTPDDNSLTVKPIDPRTYEPYGSNYSDIDYYEQNTKIYFQSEYQREIHHLRCPFASKLPQKQFAVSGDPRDVLYTTFGKNLFTPRIRAISTLIGSRYVLISDNFNIDSFGANKKGIIDPRPGLLQMGSSKHEAEEYYERVQTQRAGEINARDAFSKVIQALIRSFPQITFVLRPHPVMDGTYWHEQLSGYRNCVILYRDSVYPWIHAASCVLHTGCTTGYEAVRSGTPAIDLSKLIDKKTQSLSEYCCEQPTSLKQLAGLLSHHYKFSQPFSENKFNFQSADLRVASNYSNMLSEINQLVHGSYSSTMERFENINNPTYLFSDGFLFTDLLSDIQNSNNIQSGNSNFDYGSVISNHPPVMNKSRYLEFSDIDSRIKQCFNVLDPNGLINYSFTKVSGNTYLLKNKSLVKSNSFAASKLSNQRLKDASSKLRMMSISAWPQEKDLLLKKSLNIYSLISHLMETFGLPSVHLGSLRKLKTSDTVFILGGGLSINSYSDNDFSLLSRHDSIGLSNFLAHSFDCTYYLYEACSKWHIDFLEYVLQTSGLNSPILLNARHAFEMTSEDLARIKKNRLSFFNSRVLKVVDSNNFAKCVAQIMPKQTDLSIFHARGSLSIAYSLAVALGYKKIVLCGIELDTNKYFFEERSSRLRSAGTRDKVQECFQKEINHSKEQGYDFSGTHRTVDPRESNTLSIVDVLKFTADFAEKHMNARTFLYKKVGLLSDAFSIYQS